MPAYPAIAAMSDEDPVFRTAADLRDEERSAHAAPDFTIPERPERRYPRDAGVEYRGGAVFHLTPGGDWEESALAALVEEVLETGDYRYGDWFDLPLPLYLVHDDGTNDTFRVAVRRGTVELHVRPETKSDGLRALYERLRGATDDDWRVECRSETA